MSQSLIPGAPGGPPERVGAGRNPAGSRDPNFSARQRDFLLLTIFVLAQQGYIDRAGVLAEALHLMGETTSDVQMARAVLRFLAGEWAATLTCLEDLDRIDPLERFGDYKLTHQQRMRRYLSARCLFELGDNGRAQEALEVYLRHGEKAPRDDG